MNKSILKIILGPMFSGKSTELIKHIRNLKVIDIPIIVIKPKIDDRYEKYYICSHNKEKEECILVDNIFDIIYDESYINSKYVIIEEAQFIKNLKRFVSQELKNKSFIIAGLDGDYKRESFGEILELIPLADDVIKLKALCKICNDGTPGIFTKKIINNSEQILIGSNDTYIPTCREHYELDIESIHNNFTNPVNLNL